MALHKLATTEMLMAPEHWTHEFIGALKALDLETLRQREAELNDRLAQGGVAGLSADEKSELRSLQPTSAGSSRN